MADAITPGTKTVVNTIWTIVWTMSDVSDSGSPTRYNFGPLTTSYTFPPNCNRCVGPDEIAFADESKHALICSLYDSPDCFDRPDMCRNHIVDGAGDGQAWRKWGFFSPGLRCPDGWTTNTHISHGMRDAAFFNTALSLLSKSETAAFCCPGTLVVAPEQGDEIPHHHVCTAPILMSSPNYMKDCPGNVFTVKPRTDVDVAYSVAPIIQLVWQPTDLTETASPVPPTTAFSAGAGSASRVASATSSAPQKTTRTATPQLSPQAQIALITVGTTILAIALGLGLGFGWRKYQRLRAQHQGDGVVEKDGNESRAIPNEIMGKEAPELDAMTPPTELP